MRAKVPEEKKNRSRGISLPPEMLNAAVRRSNGLDVSFSKYVQKLIRFDLRTKLLSNQEFK